MKKAYLDALTILFSFIAIALGIVVLLRINKIQSGETIVISKDESGDEKIVIEISGEVVNPGIYEFERGAIIEEAIEAAGGLNENADQDYVNKNINRAERLQNNQKILIPGKEEGESNTTTGASDQVGKLNINTATKSELSTLPGIGDSYAQGIIDGRPYASIEEIKDVKGIGDATFEKIKDLIRV